MRSSTKTFISDMGKTTEMVNSDGQVLVIERYGVWQESRWRGKAEVVEVSGDLDALLKKYGVDRSQVVYMGPQPQSNEPATEAARTTP